MYDERRPAQPNRAANRRRQMNYMHQKSHSLDYDEEPPPTEQYLDQGRPVGPSVQRYGTGPRSADPSRSRLNDREAYYDEYGRYVEFLN